MMKKITVSKSLPRNFSVIAAVAWNGVIGSSTTNAMPWHLPADLKHFKRRTTGQTIIMGSTTFRSLPRSTALPNRRNVVISRESFNFPAQALAKFSGAAACYPTLSAALLSEPGTPIVIGGGRIYEEALRWHPMKLIITLLDIQPPGDVKFPIEGWRFDTHVLSHRLDSSGQFLVYNRTFASDWQEENGIRFCFTEFLAEEACASRLS
jgi:dihydrofolate reductase